MKHAIVTGGANFIAYHLVSYLLNNTDRKIITPKNGF